MTRLHIKFNAQANPRQPEANESLVESTFDCASFNFSATTKVLNFEDFGGNSHTINDVRQLEIL